jgi:hypothetical protein
MILTEIEDMIHKYYADLIQIKQFKLLKILQSSLY